MCVLLITWLLRGVGRWVRKSVNHDSWVAAVTPTDRPKSVRNRCLIKLFCGVVCVITFDISVGVGAFVIGLNQILSLTKLNRKQDPYVFYQVCVFGLVGKNKMAVLPSDWLNYFLLLRIC